MVDQRAGGSGQGGEDNHVVAVANISADPGSAAGHEDESRPVGRVEHPVRGYQPVASAGSAAGGAMLPSAARPTLITLACTPSDGIEIRVGMDGLNPSVEPPSLEPPSVEPPSVELRWLSPKLERPGRLGRPKSCPNPTLTQKRPTSIRTATIGSVDRGPDEVARTAARRRI